MDQVIITKVREGTFVVEWTFANGWKDAETCSTEEQARTFVNGLRRGMTSIKNMIAVGPHFSGQIIERAV